MLTAILPYKQHLGVTENPGDTIGFHEVHWVGWRGKGFRKPCQNLGFGAAD